VLADKKGRIAARGFYDPASPLAFRACSVDGEELGEKWAEGRLLRAIAIRRRLFADDGETTAYRLLNGEGDGVPGLVLDRHGDCAVMQLDGPGPEGFWSAKGIAHRAMSELSLKHVLLKPRKGAVQALAGSLPDKESLFIENGTRFAADLIRGQKTGFFLDQRDNRQRIKDLAGGRTVLNLFGYSSIIGKLAGPSRNAAPVISAVPPVFVGRVSLYDEGRVWNVRTASGGVAKPARSGDFLSGASTKSREVVRYYSLTSMPQVFPAHLLHGLVDLSEGGQTDSEKVWRRIPCSLCPQAVACDGLESPETGAPGSGTGRGCYPALGQGGLAADLKKPAV